MFPHFNLKPLFKHADDENHIHSKHDTAIQRTLIIEAFKMIVAQYNSMSITSFTYSDYEKKESR